MSEKKSVLDYGRYFSKGLPNSWVLLGALVAVSLLFSTASVAIAHNGTALAHPLDTVISGVIAGLFILIVPTILTTFIVKLATRRMFAKHLFFIAFVGCLTFGLILLASSVLDVLFNPAVAVVAVIVGAASVFGWWFFTERVISAKVKRSMLMALVQPTLLILFYIPTSGLIFLAGAPTNVLLVKLYAGIFVFGLVIYAIMYIFNKPVKKSLGFNSMDFFSMMVQEWLFGINAYKPFSQGFGSPENIPVQAMVFTGRERKAIFLVPLLHYGVMGNIGGSNFPYQLERYGNSRYRATTFVMHTAVNEDFNPVSAAQVSKLRAALDRLVATAKPAGRGMSYAAGRSKSCRVTELSFGGTSVVTFTRAPNVTEDIAVESGMLFRKLLESKSRRNIVLLDAHNSRYESAGARELEGVKFDSQYMNEYVAAIRALRRTHRSGHVSLGIGSAELYSRLRGPKDLARGNLNVALFRFDGFSYAIMQFNANNAMPSLRDEIVRHVRDKYGITAEVYTTDTHAVNSLSVNASNVLGRHTSFAALEPVIDGCIGQALGNMEEVRASYAQTELKNFMVWGRNSRERLFAVLNSLASIVRVLVPAIIVLGFVAAAWVVSII